MLAGGPVGKTKAAGGTGAQQRDENTGFRAKGTQTPLLGGTVTPNTSVTGISEEEPLRSNWKV